MIRSIDRIFLFLSGIASIIISIAGFSAAAGWVGNYSIGQFLGYGTGIRYAAAALFAVWLLISLRLLVLSLQHAKANAPSIDQKSGYGDIRISMVTVENLALKAASRIRGAKDLKARVAVNDSGLDITLRTIVDGETPIPALTEDIQRMVKGHLEETTGIPVASVAVYVANITQSQSFKSRVD